MMYLAFDVSLFIATNTQITLWTTKNRSLVWELLEEKIIKITEHVHQVMQYMYMY